MKTLNNSLAARLTDSVTTFAVCYRVTRSDSVVMGFTSLDQDLVLDNVAYAAASGLSHSAIEGSADLRVDNLDIEGMLSNDAITEADLLGGVYDGALVDVFLVDYLDFPESVSAADVVWLRTAFIAEVRQNGGTFVAELRGLTDKLTTAPLELYTPSCRVKRLGDGRCRVDTTPFTFDYSVAVVQSSRRFTHGGAAQADGYFRYGILTWNTGSNAGREMSIKSYVGGVLELLEPMPAGVQAGDTFSVVRGCDRQFATCRDVFDNVANFRGEPPHLLPGVDKITVPLA